MRVFNRVFVLLILAGLFALGVLATLHAFDLFGYRLSDLSRTLGLPVLTESVTGFVRGLEGGDLGLLPVLVLVSLAVLGLVLLELKPRTPRRVRLGPRGTFAARRAVQRRVEAYAGEEQVVFEPSARARGGTGARVRSQARSGRASKGRWRPKTCPSSK